MTFATSDKWTGLRARASLCYNVGVLSPRRIAMLHLGVLLLLGSLPAHAQLPLNDTQRPDCRHYGWTASTMAL